MELFRRLYRDLPRPASLLLFGALLGGTIGCITGLVVGLNVHPPTAWFATLEIGIPGLLAGALLGTIAGLIVRLVATSKQP